jgi:anti-sigma factor RsiW
MNHPHEDELLLLAYGELDEASVAQVETHLASCAPCQEHFARLERGRVALDLQAARPERRLARWAAVGVLAVAATVAAILLSSRKSTDGGPPAWPQPLEWSATAGYLAGGKAVITIDAQLTRLEQESPYVRP